MDISALYQLHIGNDFEIFNSRLYKDIYFLIYKGASCFFFNS